MDEANVRARQGLKLHLGCGEILLKGFVNLDVRPLAGVDLVNDARELYVYRDGCADLVYASHLLEHFWPSEARAAVKEWHRVLRPGGVLRVAVPDFEVIASRYAATGDVYDLRGLLYGSREYPDYPEDAHHSCWDYVLLVKLLRTVGFVDLRRYDWRQTEHAATLDCSSAHLPRGDFEHGQLMSLNVEATK